MSDEKDQAPETRMSVGEHLEELRSRVIRSLIYLVAAFVVCLIFNEKIMIFVLRQPLMVLKDLGYENPHLQALTPTEGFVVWLKLALVCALIVASPLIARELWRFIAAGLYPHERKYIELFGPISYLLFLAGVAFLYFAVMPTALRFLFDFGLIPEVPGVSSSERVVQAIPQYKQYISFYITMSLLMGIVFELPLFMLFFMSIRMITPATFSKYRRHFIVGAVAVLAILSPTGDAPTLILISTPVILLYEAGIILGRLLLRRKKA
jgi:Tat protein translocase TatC